MLALALGAAACLLLASVISAARRNSSKHRRTSPDTAATYTATSLNPVHHSQVTLSVLKGVACILIPYAEPHDDRIGLFVFGAFAFAILLDDGCALPAYAHIKASTTAVNLPAYSICSSPTCAYQEAATWLPCKNAQVRLF